MIVAGLTRNFARNQITGSLEVEHENLCLEKRRLNPLAAAGPFALVEGDQNPHRGKHARGEIGQRGADPHRTLPRLAGNRHQT
jgi:hypothetical protein